MNLPNNKPMGPILQPHLENSSFVSAAGLIVDEFSASRVDGHIDLGPDHHTPWGIVHGGVYARSTLKTSAAVSWRMAR